jgi:hypothetical protein
MNVYIIGSICFIFGCMTHKLFSSLLNFGRVIILCKQMILDCLYVSLIMTEDIAYIRQLKTKEMRDLGITEKTISHSQTIYDRTMNDWKGACIRKITTSCPTLLREQLDFDDWPTAIKYLQENR